MKSKHRSHEERRRARLKAARGVARHTKEEWHALVAACGYCCVRCRHQSRIQKDHIKALCHSGHDGIENLQPLCASCNSEKKDKAAHDYRPHNWRELCTNISICSTRLKCLHAGHYAEQNQHITLFDWITYALNTFGSVEVDGRMYERVCGDGRVCEDGSI